jgi:hypothetical protein
MRTPIIASIFAAFAMATLAQPASACPNGYEPAWIQGNMVCKIKTPKLGLKADQGRQLHKNSAFKAKQVGQPPRRAVKMQ